MRSLSFRWTRPCSKDTIYRAIQALAEAGMGLVIVSDDLPELLQNADRILVMNRGEIVEECAAGKLHEAKHPYTRGLLASIPRIDETRDELPVLDRSSWEAA